MHSGLKFLSDVFPHRGPVDFQVKTNVQEHFPRDGENWQEGSLLELDIIISNVWLNIFALYDQYNFVWHDQINVQHSVVRCPVDAFIKFSIPYRNAPTFINVFKWPITHFFQLTALLWYISGNIKLGQVSPLLVRVLLWLSRTGCPFPRQTNFLAVTLALTTCLQQYFWQTFESWFKCKSKE